MIPIWPLRVYQKRMTNRELSTNLSSSKAPATRPTRGVSIRMVSNVKFPFEVIHQLLHAVAHHEFCGIGRYGASGHIKKVRVQVVGVDVFLPSLGNWSPRRKQSYAALWPISSSQSTASCENGDAINSKPTWSQCSFNPFHCSRVKPVRFQ